MQVAGAAILGVGIWLKVDPRITQLLQVANTANSTNLISAAAIVLIVVGALMFLIGGLGCCGAMQESIWMLTTVSISWIIGLLDYLKFGLVLPFLIYLISSKLVQYW